MLNEPLVALDFPQSMRSFFLHLWYPITRLHARPSATKQLSTLLQFSSTQGFFLLQTLPSYYKPSLFWEFLVFTSSTREWKDKQDITKLQLYHNVNKLLLLLGYINNSVSAKIKTNTQAIEINLIRQKFKCVTYKSCLLVISKKVFLLLLGIILKDLYVLFSLFTQTAVCSTSNSLYPWVLKLPFHMNAPCKTTAFIRDQYTGQKQTKNNSNFFFPLFFLPFFSSFFLPFFFFNETIWDNTWRWKYLFSRLF